MTPVDKALEIMLNSVRPLKQEIIRILDAEGRICNNDIVSDTNIPLYKNSAMDGYAVYCADTESATENTPVTLTIIDEIQAGGNIITEKLSPSNAIRIMTGAPVPDGADAVVMIEFTSEAKNSVKIYRPVKQHENIRFAGEDIKKGQTVLHDGDTIKSADIGMLASLNFPEIQVYRQPQIAVISTGDEIVDIGDQIKPGQIRNSNAYTLCSEIKKYKAIPNYLGITKDTRDDTRKKLESAMNNDIIITSGGVSMGKYDFVREAIRDLGFNVQIETIRMKPGKPLVFAKKDEKLFFGLPGNPVSTMISFMQFVRPVLLKMMGAEKIKKPVIKAILDDEIRKKPDRKHFIRGFFTSTETGIHVSPTGPQGSGILRSMTKANCLIIIPEEISLIKKGSGVSIQLINHEEI